MIRILHIVRIMNRGGIENLIMNFYRYIDREKVQFDFLVQKDGKGAFDDEIISLGGIIYHIPYLTDIGYVKYCKTLTRFFLNHNEYRIIHSHMNSVSGPIIKSAKKAKIQIRIAHSHIGNHEGNWIKRLLRKTLQYNIGRNATNLFACSTIAAECIFGKYSKNAVIINNSIDVNRYCFNYETREKIRKEMGFKDNSIVIGNIARFHKQKNHKYLIRIFNELYKLDKHSKLLLIGDGDLQKNIENEISEMGLSNNVVFAGVRSDIPDILQAMDYFVLPSFYEGMPVVIIEAQASGLKCILSDKITNDVRLTELVSFKNIDENPLNWAIEIKNNSIYNRKDMHLQVIKKGYDVCEQAKLLEKRYFDLYTQ